MKESTTFILLQERVFASFAFDVHFGKKKSGTMLSHNNTIMIFCQLYHLWLDFSGARQINKDTTTTTRMTTYSLVYYINSSGFYLD